MKIRGTPARNTRFVKTTKISRDVWPVVKALNMEKRSLSIKGHRTSIALEPEFWMALEAAATSKKCSLPALIAQIDQHRLKKMPAPGLASALRVFCLNAWSSECGARDIS